MIRTSANSNNSPSPVLEGVLVPVRGNVFERESQAGRVGKVAALIFIGGLLLFATGILKLIDLFLGLTQSAANAAFILLSDQQVMGIAAAVELIVSWIAFTNRFARPNRSLAAITWITLLFLLYRLLLQFTTFTRPCSCGGKTLHLLGVGRFSDLIFQSALAYLVLLSLWYVGNRVFNSKKGLLKTLRNSVVKLCTAQLLISPFFCSAQSFHVQGELECTFYSKPGKVFTNQILNFEISVSSAQWHLKSLWGKDDFWERGSNGTDSFHVHYDKKGTAAGYVQPGIMPIETYDVVLPWLAYASASFLFTNRHTPPPWTNPGHDPSAHIYGTEIEFFRSGPSLPSHIRWTVSKKHVESAGKSPFLTTEGKSRAELRRQQKFKPDEPLGFLAGVYKVVATTNISDITIPLLFELKRFRPMYVVSKKDTNSWTAVHFKGRALKVESARRSRFIPDISGDKVYVYDLRYRDDELRINSIRYVLTNSWIESRSNGYLMELLDKRRKQVPLIHRADLIHLVLLSCIGLVLVFPALVYCYHYIKKQKENK